MSTKKSADNSFRDLVARLNAMSNMTPEQERSELMEAAGQAPKVLDDKDISLADIAKLAGIKEYVEPAKVSPKAEKLVESIIEFYDDNAHKFSSKTDFSGLLIPLTLNHLKSFSLIDYKKQEIKEILNEFIDHQKENGGLILKG